MAASVVSSVATRPPAELAMNGSTMAIRPRAARPDTAWLHASTVAAVAGSSRAMRRSILPPSKPIASSVAAS